MPTLASSLISRLEEPPVTVTTPSTASVRALSDALPENGKPVLHSALTGFHTISETSSRPPVIVISSFFREVSKGMVTLSPGARVMELEFVHRNPSWGAPSFRTMEREVFLTMLKVVFMPDPGVESRYIR